MSREILLKAKSNDLDYNLKQAADAISSATALIFSSGAGMSVDSGLPDFRGKNGAYGKDGVHPIYKEKGLDYLDMVQPTWFDKEPHFAWGFYAQLINICRKTEPHVGYEILHQLGQKRDYFVVTSNVDGLWQKAGFEPDKIWEVHGSVHHFQQHNGLEYRKDGEWHQSGNIISADSFDLEVDTETLELVGEVPKDEMGTLLRPNVLMFVDFGWNPKREEQQQEKFNAWREEADLSRLVVIECGAGTAIPTIRMAGERMINSHGGQLVRINPDEYRALTGIGIPLGAADALTRINNIIRS